MMKEEIIKGSLDCPFDEVTVKERLVVEGGDSNQILSQFDGPVTFSKEIIAKDKVNFKNQLKGCGPFLHNDPIDRDARFNGQTSLHFGESRAPYLLLPIIPKQ